MFLVTCPMKSISGGPELAHQLCDSLRKNGHEAYMWYYDAAGNVVDISVPSQYSKYDASQIVSVEQINGATVIVNEMAVALINKYRNRCNDFYIYWMSVDNYFIFPDGVDKRTYIEDVFCGKVDSDYHRIGKNVKHLVQSAYARDYVHRILGVSEDKIFHLGDYLNSNFFENNVPIELKQNIIVYNPKKGYEDLKPLIEICPEYKWIPIIGLSPQEVTTLLSFSKIYIDFGNHPGKDRIPREAAIRGCAVITNKRGSAAYFEDVAIKEKYKFQNPQETLDDIKKLIGIIFDEFETIYNDFEDYRSRIRNEKDEFYSDVITIFS